MRFTALARALTAARLDAAHRSAATPSSRRAPLRKGKLPARRAPSRLASGRRHDEAAALQLDADLFEADNKDYTIKVYEGVGHGFMNESPEPYANETAKDEGFEAIGVDKTFYPYDADVANAAWGSLFDFFEKYL